MVEGNVMSLILLIGACPWKHCLVLIFRHHIAHIDISPAVALGKKVFRRIGAGYNIFQSSQNQSVNLFSRSWLLSRGLENCFALPFLFFSFLGRLDQIKYEYEGAPPPVVCCWHLCRRTQEASRGDDTGTYVLTSKFHSCLTRPKYLHGRYV